MPGKIWVLTACKGHPGNIAGQNHLDIDGHMLPGAHIVASPHSSETLRSSEERASENKGSFRRV
jgi:hypothetical protein